MTDRQALIERVSDPAWRLRNLYQIVTKEDQGEGLVVTFNPNAAQRHLLAALHNRNIVLKARQLGISTLVCLLWLDSALFASDPIACAIVAQDRNAASKLFDKVVFAYDRLPDVLRQAFPVTKRTSEEVAFGHNGSSIRVATSARGGTLHRLHISEMGKIGAMYPQKAREIVTGSIPSVPTGGIVIVESTAEGQSGRFYEMVKAAQALKQMGRAPTERDYRLHFFPWWQAPEYRLDPQGIALTPTDNAYFDEVEAKTGTKLDARQRAWYAATLRSADFAGERPMLWQEFPSYEDEPFKVPQEGCYYSQQLADARKGERIRQTLPVEPGVPVNTFWDIGHNDATAIWLHQKVGPENRFIGFHKASGEPPSYYARWLLAQGYVYGLHYLPHDADHKRLGTDVERNMSFREIMERIMPGQRFEIVPRIEAVLTGIQSTRTAMASCWWDETACDEGLRDLALYRKEWDEGRGTWKDRPFHGPESNAADAFRQFGQTLTNGASFTTSASRPGSRGFRRRGSAMAV